MNQATQAAPKAPFLDFGENAVASHLMEDPDLYGLAASLAKVEHWVFDRINLPVDQRISREQLLATASSVISDVVKRLDAGAELIDFICSISSRRRFVLIQYLETVRPTLIGDLAQYAVKFRHQQPNCAHYIHWLDIVSRAQLIARIFSQENVDAVNALLERLRH